MDDVPWRVPAVHDPATRDALARWVVLRDAGRFDWDDSRGTSWHRMPSPPHYAPLLNDLVAMGLDPNATQMNDHATTLALLRARAHTWTDAQAAEAFVAGLWSAPAAWRSALPAALIARQLPEHEFTPWGGHASDLCEVCGFHPLPVQIIDQWAFRLLEGTPLDGDPAAYAQTLGWFGEQRPVASEYDRWALGAIIAVLHTLPAGTRYSTAANAINNAAILRGSRTAAKVLEDLALCGVLASPEHPGMYERFSSYRERDARPNVRVEVQAPLAWWDTSVGDHGVRIEVFEALFGNLDIPHVVLDGPRPTPLPAAEETIDGGLASFVRKIAPAQPKVAASVGSEPVAAGDVWAIRLEPGRWVTVYVHEVRERGRRYGHAEFLAGVFDDMPTSDAVSSEVQPRVSGRAPTWVHSLEKTPWMRRIAQGVDAPQSAVPRPDSGSWTSAKDLRNLSDWHFGY